ncbi:serine dehydratase subunit alpha family protein [Desulfovibrio inopinatus]|uniref:L-cysteine desulfidase family protein n=1 Tax=Desulfovibrio inopinatus TaxID=102109 RepID=UPI0004025437|nr:L-serine ammonia-lyase, iron-sulfur-dependent, subunit alpha [Desulfovibrio inopinatus]
MDLHAFFANEVKPALGCTEPGAVALAASAGARYLSGPPRHIHLRLSANIYKNGRSVGIPGAPGLKGNLLAAALGALGGDPDKGLQALENIDETMIAQATAMLEAGSLTEEVLSDTPNVYAEVELLRQGESVTAVVAHAHDQVVEVSRNRQTVYEGQDGETGSGRIPAYISELMRADFNDLWALAGSIDDATVGFLLEGVAMNLQVAEKGLKEPWGLGTGYVAAANLPQDDLAWMIRAWSAAAADVRMDGGRWPVMSSAGSGNHGLTAIIPPALAARVWKRSNRELAEALALSHLVTGAIKAKTGRLTPVCGCSVAAGAGAAAALTRLAHGTAEQAEQAVAYVLSSVMGMICDGAKATCSLKVGTASAEAFMGMLLATHGTALSSPQGIVGPQFTANAKAVGELSGVGFAAVDAVILRLLERQAAIPTPSCPTLSDLDKTVSPT